MAVSRLLIVALAVAALPARGAEVAPDARAALADIKGTLGFVPGFLAVFPEEGLPGAWDEFKSVQLNRQSAIPPKYKELIGLGVAAQIPCRYCIAFHTQVSTALDGASQAEVQEALAMAAIVRHWSTFLNGVQIDKKAFKAEVDRVMAPAKKSARLQAAQR